MRYLDWTRGAIAGALGHRWRRGGGIRRGPGLGASLLASLIALVASTARANSVFPQELSVQGVLRDSSGALQSSSAMLTVKFFDMQTGGNQLGSTVGPMAVLAQNGLFGAAIPLKSSDLAALAGAPDVYLEVTVGTDVFPRSKVEPELYALIAAQADSLSVNCSGCVTDAMLAGNISASKISGSIPSATNFSGALAGDVTGTQSATVVVKLNGIPIASTAPSSGQALVYNGTQWAPANLSLAGDVSGTLGAAAVTHVQGVPVSTISPTTGQALVYSGAAWAPSPVGSVTSVTPGAGLTSSTGGAITSSGTISLNTANPIWVDLTSNQNNIAGNKTFTGTVTGAARDASGTPLRVCVGTTPAGTTNWQLYGTGGLTVVVDTSGCGFTSTPIYVVNTAGDSGNWQLVGGSSPYSRTATGFQIYIQYANGTQPALAAATAGNWHVEWAAYGR